jgi:predicted O-methyltransferase YrrM
MFLNESIREIAAQPFTYPTSVDIAVGEFLYGLTRNVKPKLIVEIGCFIGFSTLHFAQALRENGRGRIISVDLFEPQPDANLADPLEIAHYYRDKSNFEDIITYKKGHSVGIAKQIRPEIKEQIDLLFIDGDHSVKGIFADFNAYYNELKVGGYLLLHDINPKKCDVYGPRVLIDYLKYNWFIPRYIEMTEILTTDGYGIALFRKVYRRSIHVHVSLSLPLLIKWKLIVSRRKPYIIKVTIRNSETKKPIQGALLTCQEPNFEVLSNAQGAFMFERVPPKTYSVDILAEGYEPVRNYKIKVPRNKSLNLYIDLRKLRDL